MCCVPCSALYVVLCWYIPSEIALPKHIVNDVQSFLRLMQSVFHVQCSGVRCSVLCSDSEVLLCRVGVGLNICCVHFPVQAERVLVFGEHCSGAALGYMESTT